MGLFGPPNIEKMLAKNDVEGLIKACQHKQANVRAKATGALGKIGVARAVVPLISMLKDKEIFVCYAAIKALGQISDTRAVNALTHELIQMKRHLAAAALGEIGNSEAVNSLISALIDSQVSYYAKSTLDKIKPNWHEGTEAKMNVPQFIVALTSENKYVRKTAAELLGLIRDIRAVEPLIFLLKDDKYGEVHRAAIEALGQIGDERAVEPLINCLKENAIDCVVVCLIPPQVTA